MVHIYRLQLKTQFRKPHLPNQQQQQQQQQQRKQQLPIRSLKLAAWTMVAALSMAGWVSVSISPR